MQAPPQPVHTAPIELVRRSSQPRGLPLPVPAEAMSAVRDALVGVPIAQRDLLIEHLHRLQDRFGQLRTDHLGALAELMRLSVAEVYEVASFYHHFDIARPGSDGRVDAPPALTVRVCTGIACELAGGSELLGSLQVSLAAKDLRVVAAPCIGRCEQAPAALVHQRALAQATLESVQAVVERGDRSPEPIEPAVGPDGNEGVRAYAVLAECLAGARSAEQVMTTLEASGLRGLGGAGFPAGLKWRAVRAATSPRLMAVNIDEGEPGTFKDRFHLERNAKRFLEGLLIAAWATEIDNVFIFLRDEYHACRALLERELAALRASPPMPGLPMIELRRGAGAYVCGEESAMFESIEGKRGLPRWRPPHAAERGLFGLPTLVHNFETLVWVPEVLQRGADDFAAAGRRGCKGLRSFSVSGRVRLPGVKIAPAGITLNELLAEHCGGLPDGHRLYAWLPGGASGGILPASLADVPLDFGTLEPHGGDIGTAAVVVLSESDTHRDRAVDAARNLMAFFATESCGQCTPCRSGTARMLDLVRTEHWDRALLADLSLVMREASICGLGRAAPNPVDCVLRHFSHELT